MKSWRLFALASAATLQASAEADLVLGIDFLGSRRVWISYGSQQLFLMHRI